LPYRFLQGTIELSQPTHSNKDKILMLIFPSIHGGVYISKKVNFQITNNIAINSSGIYGCIEGNFSGSVSKATIFSKKSISGKFKAWVLN